MSTFPDVSTLAHFFTTLYGACEDGWMVLSSPDPRHLTGPGTPALRSTWFDVARASWDKIARAAAHLAQQQTVYHSVALQHPDCEPHPWHRGKNGTAYTVVGLWFDLDLVYGQHAASTLPQSDQEALDFLHNLPAPPSLIIGSGGGMYSWHLFREPYVIETDAVLVEIAHLARQFTHTLVEAGKLRDWTLDALGDLGRVLRPPGSTNWKYGSQVTILEETTRRYDPTDFDWLLPLPTPARAAAPRGPGVTGQPNLVAIAEHYGTVLTAKSTTELAGAHPVHGSSTSTNFNVNPDKGLWHCWRHGTGGDALTLIGACEGVLDCESARSGALTGDVFRRVLQVARHTFHADLPPDPVERVHGLRVRTVAARPHQALRTVDIPEGTVCHR
jgi:hypothetical protein